MPGIYTRGGDAGETSLRGGDRIPKDDPRVEAFGDIDEANCAIGLARAVSDDHEIDDLLEFVQQRLYNCSAIMAAPAPTPENLRITADDVGVLEHAIDRYSERIGGFQGFVLPSHDKGASRLHVARAVLRRAERSAVRVSRQMELDPQVLAFLNRASDLLYVAARFSGSGSDVMWRPDAEPPTSA